VAATPDPLLHRGGVLTPRDPHAPGPSGTSKDAGPPEPPGGAEPSGSRDTASPGSGVAGTPRNDRKRRRRALLLARVIGLASIAIALALYQFTQTTTGRNAAVSLLQGALQNAIHGQIRIGPVLGGNLLTRVVLSRIEIADSAGATFVALDSVTIEYHPLALLRRQVRIRRLVAGEAEIRLVQDAGGRWNYERIFQGEAPSAPPDPVAAPADTAGTEPGGSPLRFLIRDATMRSGRIEIRIPWTATLEGEARERALAEIEEGSIWHVEPTADGEFERVYRIEDGAGRFPAIRVIDPPRPFRIELADVLGTLFAVRQPLEIDEFDGVVTFGDTIDVAIRTLETPASSLTGEGWVVAGDPLQYGFDLEADPLGFRDLAWLPVPVPRSGGGPMRLALASRGEIPVVEVTDGRIESEETRIRGGFRIALGETPVFERIDATLAPLRLRWLDELLDRPPVVDGLITGTVRGSGRPEALAIDADVTLTPLDAGVSASALRARGGVAMVEPYGVRDLALELESFDPAWAAILGFDAPLDGRLDGALTVSRPPGGALSASGHVTHVTPAGDVSRLEGDATVDLDEGSVIDVDLRADPLALAALEPFAPDLDLVGTVSGPLRARGTLSDLLAEADLETARGRLTFDGRFGLEGEPKRYDARVEASDVDLREWMESAPATRLAVRGRVVGSGVELATLDADFDLEILPSELDLAELDTSYVRVRVADGLAEIDTLILRSDVGSVTGRGSFGVAEGRSGTVTLEASVLDLSEWNRWVAEEIPGGRAADEGEFLFEDFAAAMAGPDAEGPAEGLRGRLEGRGVVEGTLEDFSVEAFVEATDARFEDTGADSLSARLVLQNPPSTDELVADVTARDARIRGVELDSLALDLMRAGPGPVAVDVHARRDSTVALSAAGRVELGSGSFDARLDSLSAVLGKVGFDTSEPARIAYSDSALVIEGLVVAGPLGRIEADGTIPSAGDGSMTVAVAGFRVDQLGYLFSDAPEVGGTLYADGTVGGTLSEPSWRGTARILDPAIREHRYTALEATFGYDDRRLEGSVDLTLDGHRLAHAEGFLRADLALRDVERRLLDEPVDIQVRADSLPLEILELRVRGLQDIEGFARGSVTLSGEPGELQYGGDLGVVGGAALVPDLGIRLVGIGGHAAFQGSGARIDSLRVASEDGGTASVSGVLDVSTLSNPALDLDLSATRFQAVSRRDMTLAVEGTGHLGGQYRSPRLEGDFRLRDGDIHQDEFLRQQQVIDLSDPSFYSLLDSAAVGERRLLQSFQNPFMDNLVIDATVDLGPNLWLRSPQIDVELVAQDLDVYVDRASDVQTVRGIVELPRGTYRFDRIQPYVQSLRITSGTLQFTGGSDFNPDLSINAEYRSRTSEGPVVIEVHIGGTLQNTQLALASNPPMSDTDQLCFLAVGAPCFAAADNQLGQRLFQEAVLGTLTTGLSSALVGSTGLSYFNLRSVGGGTQGSRVAGSQNLFDRTAVEFGWYASEEIFFTFSQPLGGGPPRATLEWRFAPNWALEARTASRLDERLFGLFQGTNLANDRTFGLFLFREWSY